MWLAPCLAACQALSFAESVDHWWEGQVHKAADYRSPGILGLVLTHGWTEPGSGVGGCGAGVPRSGVVLLVGGSSS